MEGSKSGSNIQKRYIKGSKTLGRYIKGSNTQGRYINRSNIQGHKKKQCTGKQIQGSIVYLKQGPDGSSHGLAVPLD